MKKVQPNKKSALIGKKEFSLRPKNSNKLISKLKGVEYTWTRKRETGKVVLSNLLFLRGMALIKSPTWVSR